MHVFAAYAEICISHFADAGGTIPGRALAGRRRVVTGIIIPASRHGPMSQSALIIASVIAFAQLGWARVTHRDGHPNST
jgi:hypothetical protein